MKRVLIALFLSVVFGTATAHDRKPSPEPAPDTQTGTCCIKKDKEIPAAVVTAAVLTVVAIVVCAWKRFVLNDPCITNEPNQTSAADDRVTPTHPAPGFGLNVEVTR